MNTRLISILLLPPFIASIFGAYIAHVNDISIYPFSSNIIAVVLGVPLALSLGSLQISSQRYIIILSILTFTLIAASLFTLGMAGVHRWIAIGSINLNVSMIFSPIVLYLICIALDRYTLLSVVLAISVSAIHVLQPDAGQATAFGSAAIVIFLFGNRVSFRIRLMSIILLIIEMILAWFQPDPLPSIAQVECILQLASKIGNFGIAGIAFSIIFMLVPIFYAWQHQTNKLLVAAFTTYIIAEFCVTVLGNYPVPILGAGASSILGYYVILGLILAPLLLKPSNAR